MKILEKNHSLFSPVTQDNLLIVQGATEGISLIFFYLTTFLPKPYSVLSFDPVYESYPKLSNIFNIPFFYFNFEDDLSIDFTKLEKIIKQKKVKIVFIASPGNPLGKVWQKNEVEQMIYLSKKMKFYLIFDSVYKDIYFKNIPYNPLHNNSSSPLSDRLFYVTSFSKMLSITGWRVGYIITEKNHMRKIRDIHDYTGLSAPSLFQDVIYEYLNTHNYGIEYIAEIRQKCLHSFAYMKENLEKLEDLDIDKKREEEKIKLIVKRNQQVFTSHVKTLISEIEKIEQEDQVKDFIDKIDLKINSFEKSMIFKLSSHIFNSLSQRWNFEILIDCGLTLVRQLLEA